MRAKTLTGQAIRMRGLRAPSIKDNKETLTRVFHLTSCQSLWQPPWVAQNPMMPCMSLNSDGPELWLFSHPLIGPKNYSSWAREFRRALITKDKEGFIDGTIPIPTDEKIARQWKKCNQLVRTWIGNCISLEIATGLPPTEDSKTI